jgi:hypothetical protein
MSNELTSLPQALASAQYPLPQIPSRAMRHPEAPVVEEQIRDCGLSSENDFLRSEKRAIPLYLLAVFGTEIIEYSEHFLLQLTSFSRAVLIDPLTEI